MKYHEPIVSDAVVFAGLIVAALAALAIVMEPWSVTEFILDVLQRVAQHKVQA